MSKPVVLVTRKLPDSVEQKISEHFDAILNPTDRLHTPDEILELSEHVDAILPCHTERFAADTINALSDRVRAICNYSVGVDHVDLDAAKEKGVIVTNTPDVLSDATAEIAMLLILGAARRASEGEKLVRTRQWQDWSPAFMVGTQITGKKLGVLGMGRVGQVLAQRARGFDMEIHYHNRHALDDQLGRGAIYHARVEDMLAAIDVLSIHCPATPQTRGMINEQRLSLLHSGAIVVNTSRGAVVDDDALVKMLVEKRIAAAGLDVFNGEPDHIHPRYRDLDNTFLLPHIGSATRETREAMGLRALANLVAIFDGSEPRDRVA